MAEAGELLVNYPEDSELAVIHLVHGDERCNRDDMEHRQVVDAATADSLLSMGEARWCTYCDPTNSTGD